MSAGLDFLRAKHSTLHEGVNFYCIQAPQGSAVAMVPIHLCKPKYELGWECNFPPCCQSCQQLWSSLTPCGFSLIALASLKESLIQKANHKMDTCVGVISYMAKGKTVSSTHNTSDTKCVGFTLTLSNSDTNYLELVQIPKVKGSVPQDCPPLDTNHKWWVPRLPTLLIWLQIRDSHDPLFRFHNLLHGSWTQGNTTLTTTGLL